MQNFDFDVDEILFGGSPLSRLADILSVANKNLVESELEKLFMKMAAMEAVLNEKGVGDKEIAAYISQNEDAIKDDVLSIALALAGDIVTRNE